MSLNATPKANRLHIAAFGRRNVGKSSFLNAFIGQQLSIVSDTPGTTTDPVERAYELHPVGPVLLIDTAGIDDIGALGEKRIEKTQDVINRTDFAFLVIEKDNFGDFEKELIAVIKKKSIPWMIIVNKEDLIDPSELIVFIEQISTINDVKVMTCAAVNGKGIEEIKEYASSQLNTNKEEPPIVSDLVSAPDPVVLVIPIDTGAPKGRLILPQTQTIRDLLDADIPVTIANENNLYNTLDQIMKIKPKMVITDSQAFAKVAANTPDDVLLTSFSILFARQKGDLAEYVKGVQQISKLKNGDNILISELCSHRPLSEDIGRIKIPHWLRESTGLNLNFDVAVGKDFPKDPEKYSLIIQCGGCVVNRAYVMSRIDSANNTPITNYGITIAYLHGILKRALKPFPETHQYIK